MKFKVEIKNFGKIERATIQINNLTVLAGKNNVGKSFISKALYAFFHAMNTVHLHRILTTYVDELLEILNQLKNSIPYYNTKDDKFITEIQNILSTLKEKLLTIKNIHLSKKLGFIDSIANLIKQLEQTFIVYQKQIGSKKRKIAGITLYLGKIGNIINQLRQYTDKKDNIKLIISQNLGKAFENELKLNFQVNKLQELKRTNSTDSISFDIETIGKILVTDKDRVNFSITGNGLDTLQQFSQIIYLESPIYWKLKSALESYFSDAVQVLWRRGSKTYLIGVPNYFYDLANLLRLQSTDEPQFKDILENISQEIGGRLHLSNKGNLVFQTQKEGTHSISITALGVANLGMIALLLEKNLIDKGTFLFIDEPEAHLHPAWQVTLIKTLYQLASKGVNIVITTHSIDMLKCLEILVKENAKAKELIALNHLGSDGYALNEDVEFEEKIGLMKQDLLEPFYNLYLEGL